MDKRIFQEEFETFVREMTSSKTMPVNNEAESLFEICKLLRVGKITITICDSLDQERENGGKEIVIHDSGNASAEPEIEKRHVTEGMTVNISRVYPIEGAEPWDNDERESVDLVMNVLFVFGSRARLVSLAEKLTYFDADGYYNLRYFIGRVESLSHQDKLYGRAAVRFNLKHFSHINQRIGREAGNIVMRRFINHIERIVGNKGIVCRIGGDNFALLVMRSELDNVLDYITGADVVYDLQSGARVRVSATAGIYVIPKDSMGIKESDIMDKLMTASQIARSVSRDDIVFYNETLNENRDRLVKIQAVFPEAIKKEEFMVYYQPKVLLSTGEIAGAEALCRWNKEGRIALPSEFIPVLEQTMDICTLDFYMLEHVCMDMRRWLDEGRKIVRVSVNLSRKHMMDHDLFGTILNIIDKYKVPHEFIEIELTETTTDVEFRDLKRVVKGLQNAGICTSMDDFGIGYSSLKLLNEIPWNVLKVDRGFLPGGDGNIYSRRAIMFKYVVAMAQELGLECIAEGVETVAQVKILRQNKCKLAQGFFFDRPLTVKEFEMRLTNRFYNMEG